MVRFSISNETGTRLPRASRTAFHAIAGAALPKAYDLNLIFVKAPKIRKLNKIYRNIDAPTDILSFPMSKNEGEIYICPSEARKESAKFGRSYDNFVKFLLIHGTVHLIGHDHGGTMEHIEAKIRRKFKV